MRIRIRIKSFWIRHTCFYLWRTLVLVILRYTMMGAREVSTSWTTPNNYILNFGIKYHYELFSQKQLCFKYAILNSSWTNCVNTKQLCHIFFLSKSYYYTVEISNNNFCFILAWGTILWISYNFTQFIGRLNMRHFRYSQWMLILITEQGKSAQCVQRDRNKWYMYILQ